MDYTRGVKLSRCAPLAVTLAGWAALYAPLLLRGWTLPVRDVAATAVPWRSVWTAHVRSFSLPLWDPLSSGGRPLLANPNSGAAYPGTVLFLLAPPETAVVLYAALHHLLLVLGFYRLARAVGSKREAAGIAAAACASGGLVWSSLTFLNLQASLAWAPWALAAVAHQPKSVNSARWQIWWAGVCCGLSVLGGEPVTALLLAITTVSVVWLGWHKYRMWGLLGLPVVAGATAAPLLVPFLAILPETSRIVLGSPPGALTADALAPRRFLELFLPSLLGPPFADLETGFWAAASFPWQRYFPLLFVGSLVPVLLWFALRRRDRLRPWLLVGTAGLLLALALGVESLATWLASVPGVAAVRYSIKLLVVPLLCLPAIVAAGWEELVGRWQPAFRRRLALAVASLAVVFAMLALTGPGERLTRHLLGSAYPASRVHLAKVPSSTIQHAMVRDTLVLIVPLAALAAAGPAAGVVATAALFANALAGIPSFLPAPSAEWATPPAICTALPPKATIAALARFATPQQQPSERQLQRFWAARAALHPEYGLRWGMRYVLARGPDGLEPARSELLARIASTLPLEMQGRLAAALGAQAVIACEPIPSWPCLEVDGVWSCTPPSTAPPVYVARRALWAHGLEAAAWTMGSTGFTPGFDVVLEQPAPLLSPGAILAEEGPPHCRRFRVQTAGPSLLVVQQSFMKCWQARVDGQPVHPLPVNGAHIGVEVPAGEHNVEVFLDPLPYRLGACGPLLVAVLFFLVFLKAKSSPSHE